MGEGRKGKAGEIFGPKEGGAASKLWDGGRGEVCCCKCDVNPSFTTKKRCPIPPNPTNPPFP